MNSLRATLFLFLLLLGGCQSIDFHPFRAGSLETLSEPEVQAVMDKFKVLMARSGLQQLFRPGENSGHYARFSSSATPPFNTYADLAYVAEEGFVLKFSRTTVNSKFTDVANSPFTDERIIDIKQQAEQLISEATSKTVPLRVYVELP